MRRSTLLVHFFPQATTPWWIDFWHKAPCSGAFLLTPFGGLLIKFTLGVVRQINSPQISVGPTFIRDAFGILENFHQSRVQRKVIAQILLNDFLLRVSFGHDFCVFLMGVLLTNGGIKNQSRPCLLSLKMLLNPYGPSGGESPNHCARKPHEYHHPIVHSFIHS